MSRSCRLFFSKCCWITGDEHLEPGVCIRLPQESLQRSPSPVAGFFPDGCFLQLIFNLCSLVRMQKACSNWITVVYLLTLLKLCKWPAALTSICCAFSESPEKSFITLPSSRCVSTSYCLKPESLPSRAATLPYIHPSCCPRMVFGSADVLRLLVVWVPLLEPHVFSSSPVEILALIKALRCHLET